MISANDGTAAALDILSNEYDEPLYHCFDRLDDVPNALDAAVD